jgi:hypothetical protein
MNVNIRQQIYALPLVLLITVTLLSSFVTAAEPELIAVKKIWDDAKHSAFTDLIRFKGKWLCCFREATTHGSKDGEIRIIESSDGNKWVSVGHVVEKETDLRDPKLSIDPSGRLVLIMGGSRHRGDAYVTRSPRISFSSDSRTWTVPQKLLAEDHWLWRITWHDGIAYSVSKLGEGRDPRRGMLYKSTDCIDWEYITEFRLPDNTWNASETTLRFMPDGEMIALTRPEWIGRSQPPYTDWKWTKTAHRMGGPNFIRLPNGQLWAGARLYLPGGSKTGLIRMTPTSYEPILQLPSGGDTSYPGMVWHEGILWMSYYSSHEGKTSIYLATIRLPEGG